MVLDFTEVGLRLGVPEALGGNPGRVRPEYPDDRPRLAAGRPNLADASWRDRVAIGFDVAAGVELIQGPRVAGPVGNLCRHRRQHVGDGAGCGSRHCGAARRSAAPRSRRRVAGPSLTDPTVCPRRDTLLDVGAEAAQLGADRFVERFGDFAGSRILQVGRRPLSASP